MSKPVNIIIKRYFLVIKTLYDIMFTPYSGHNIQYNSIGFHLANCLVWIKTGKIENTD